MLQFMAHSTLNKEESIKSSWPSYFLEISILRLSLKLVFRSYRKQQRWFLLMVANSMVVSMFLRIRRSLRCSSPIAYFCQSRRRLENRQRRDLPWIIFSAAGLQGIVSLTVNFSSSFTQTQFTFFFWDCFFSVFKGAASFFSYFLIAAQKLPEILLVGASSKANLILLGLFSSRFMNLVLLLSYQMIFQLFEYFSARWNPTAFWLISSLNQLRQAASQLAGQFQVGEVVLLVASVMRLGSLAGSMGSLAGMRVEKGGCLALFIQERVRPAWAREVWFLI